MEFSQVEKEKLLVAANIKNDPAIKNLLSRMPDKVAESFNEEQLAHLQVALGARSWGKHAIDFRSTVTFFSHRYYYVFVAGRNRREMTRAEKRLGLLIQSAVFTGFIALSTVIGVVVLYLIKSAMGIDIFPNFSFGLWSWFKESFLQ